MKKIPEAWIFDFDGAVADTEPFYWKGWGAILAIHGIDFSCEEYCLVGRGVQDESMLQATLNSPPIRRAREGAPGKAGPRSYGGGILASEASYRR
jgi:beta-phosphoglucomutase-like phosphatase (HAD superfamily)